MPKAPAKLDLPEAIIIGGWALFFDILSVIPGIGIIFLLLLWGIFKFKNLSAPLPFGSMFFKAIPLFSLIPMCLLYVFRVYKRNQPGSIFAVLSTTINPVGDATAVAASLSLAPKELGGDSPAQEAGGKKKAA